MIIFYKINIIFFIFYTQYKKNLLKLKESNTKVELPLPHTNKGKKHVLSNRFYLKIKISISILTYHN